MSGLIPAKLEALDAYDPDLNQCRVHLDANESFLELSDELKGKIAKKIAAISFNRYPDPLALKVCEAFGRRYGVSADYITAGNGSDELISVILNSFTGRGDKVLITRPDFSMYSVYCTLAEAEPVILGKDRDLTFSPDDMIRLARKNKIRLVLFSNPCNPTGQGVAAGEILRIARSLDCLVVVDEAYMDFWNESVIQDAPSFSNLIVLKTCSKIGFAAARLGFAVACDRLTGLIRAAKSPYNINVMTQAAGEAFLQDNRYFKESIATITCSRESLYNGLKELEAVFPKKIRVYETHTNFVTAELRQAGECHKRLKEKGISVRLLADRYLRITAGDEEENSSFLKEMRIMLEGTGEHEES